MCDFVIICIYDKSNPNFKAFDVCSKSNQRNYQHQFKKTIAGERGSRNALVSMFKDVAVENIGYETISNLECSKAEAIKKLDAFALAHNAITTRTHKLNITNEVKEFLESNSENGSVISDEVEEVVEVKPPPPTKKVIKQKPLENLTQPSQKALLTTNFLNASNAFVEAKNALERYELEQANATKLRMSKLTQPKAPHIPLDLSKLAVDKTLLEKASPKTNEALNKQVKQDKADEKKAKQSKLLVEKATPKNSEPLIKADEVADVLEVVEIDVDEDEDEAEIKALKAKLDTLKAKKAKKH